MAPTKSLPRLAPRPRDSHKGDYGRAFLVGGSRGMAGAIGLAGMAALRSGAGLVTLGVPDAALEVVAGFEPSYMTVPLPDDVRGRLRSAAFEPICEFAAQVHCVACGPGLGRSEPLTELVGALYANLKQPLVVDADALYALAERPDGFAEPGGPRVLTPHPGEFRRLIGGDTLTRPQQEQRAEELARRYGIVILLKGSRTFITDGEVGVHNETGNPGMATGGCGDVLTGIITALICQGLSPRDAAHLGAHVHGLAGDLAAAELGEVSLIASDLLRYLPRAFQQTGTGP